MAIRSLKTFHWSLTQKHFEIDGQLADFQGAFVGDATGANAKLAARTRSHRIEHQSRNALARRYFIEAQSSDTVLASQMIAMYRQLYAVDYHAALLSVAERLELSQLEAVPIWQRMRAWLDQEQVKRLLGKSDIGEAAAYLCIQWDDLGVA